MEAARHVTNNLREGSMSFQMCRTTTAFKRGFCVQSWNLENFTELINVNHSIEDTSKS